MQEETQEGMVEVSSDDLVHGAIAALDPNSPMRDKDRNVVLQEFERIFGPGSIEDLMGKLQGGDGEAVSDGQSDSIPAVIDGEQPAALSEGEYVIPADVVSSLGNGDTESGVRRLNKMIEEIRKETTGTPEQPPAVDAGATLAGLGGIR